jgi:hypothetical protein
MKSMIPGSVYILPNLIQSHPRRGVQSLTFPKFILMLPNEGHHIREYPDPPLFEPKLFNSSPSKEVFSTVFFLFWTSGSNLAVSVRIGRLIIFFRGAFSHYFVWNHHKVKNSGMVSLIVRLKRSHCPNQAHVLDRLRQQLACC